jgi:predicted ATPase/class 3 adenylate cyclase
VHGGRSLTGLAISQPGLISTSLGDASLVTAQTLTFLFTDIEGSTALLQRLGDAYAQALADHHQLIRDALAAYDGKEIDTQGDAFFAAFSSASACVSAAIKMQRELLAHAWPAGEAVRVRMGIHSGEATRTADGLVGFDVHRAARIAAAAHGGQIVLSATTAALLRDTLPEGAWLKDLGTHRLKDLGRSEQIFQLTVDGLPAAFPPLRALGSLKPPDNLPAQVSAFIGRESELTEVGRLIAASRLVTLTGSAGVGKTRLALRAAVGRPDGSSDGVWFVDLASLQDPDLVTTTVASVLGVRGDTRPSAIDMLLDAVGERSMLVLLDNCEHVIDACAKLADTLLRNCPNIRLLVTSREPLGIDGERVHRVPPLDTPADDDDVETIHSTEAVRLFVDRAAQHGVTLTWDERTASVAGSICRRLDGSPLAIELAAARLPVMSVIELDARLDQRFAILTGGSRAALPRQQTLLAMLDWSWELLNGAERHVLARLSVFAGGFDLAAAEAVAAAEADADVLLGQIVGHLGALVDKNLVQFEGSGGRPVRYRLLETVRQYAERQLESLGPAADAARSAHRNQYVALAEAATAQLVGRDQSEWLDRLDLELGNIRAAIAYSLKRRDPTPGIRLAAALREFWKTRGHATEGIEALRALLDLPTQQEQTLLRARGLAAAAYLLEQSGGYTTAEEYCEDGLAIARAAGDDYLIADLSYLRALVLLRRGQPGRALPFIESGLSLARQCKEPHVTARLLAARSFALDLQGDHAAAVRDARESVLLHRRAGDTRHVGTMLGNLGYVELSLGEFPAARAHLAESLDIAHALNDHYGVVYQTLNLGLAEYLGGSLTAAEDLFTESLQLAVRLRNRASIAYALVGLAMTDRGEAGMSRSARLHGAAAEALAVLEETIEPLEGDLRDRDCQRLRHAMGAEAFEAEYAAGRALTAEEVLDLASDDRF